MKDTKVIFKALLEKLILFIYCEGPNSQNLPSSQESNGQLYIYSGKNFMRDISQ